jgi:hypothetical protein
MPYYNGKNPEADLARADVNGDGPALDDICRRIGYGRAQQIIQYLWAIELRRRDVSMSGALLADWPAGALCPQRDLQDALAMVKGDRDRLSLELEHLKAELAELEARFARINTPEIGDFLAAVRNEMLHQRDRWGADGDAGKTDADWFWLLGFLAQKAMTPGTSKEKVLHHIITTAAACGNWHGARTGHYVDMRPGTVQQGSSHD